MITLVQLIADLTDEAQQKDSLKSFASVNKLLGDLQSGQGRSNGCGHGNGYSRGRGAGCGALLGNQGPAKDTLNKYR